MNIRGDVEEEGKLEGCTQYSMRNKGTALIKLHKRAVKEEEREKVMAECLVRIEKMLLREI